MSNKALKRAHVIQNYIEGSISRKKASEMVGLSERQITRLARRFKETGASSLIHNNTGRKPIHALTAQLQETILQIHQLEIYAGCNISHFCELLEQKHGIKISYKPLYNLLRSAGIKSPKLHKKKKRHHRRKRKAHAGELLQIDASPFQWLGSDEKFALHALIDDATGEITGMYLTKNECLFGYLEVMRQTCLNYGYPAAVYSDKHTIFRSPKTERMQELGQEANLTQFGRALYELGIEIIHAHSPQAKGRIERLWGTLQSRLPIEFKMRGIQTIEAANEFLEQEFRKVFNLRFAVKPTEESMFVPISSNVNLEHYLCIKEARKMDNAGVISFHGKYFKVLDEGHPIISAKASVFVFVTPSNKIFVQYKERIFNTINIQHEPKRSLSHKHKLTICNVLPHMKYGDDSWKKIWHFEGYNESLKFLYDLFFKPVEHKILNDRHSKSDLKL